LKKVPSIKHTFANTSLYFFGFLSDITPSHLIALLLKIPL